MQLAIDRNGVQTDTAADARGEPPTAHRRPPEFLGEGQCRMIDRSKDRLIRIAEVRHRTGLSTATIYRKIDGLFSQRRKLSVHVVAWYEGDVDAWVAGFDENAAA